MKTQDPGLTPEEQQFCTEAELPFFISTHLKKVLERLYVSGQRDGDLSPFYALRRQYVPSIEEKNVLPCELSDPLGAHRYQITPRLVHQYKNRVLLLTTARCFAYCRHCFRRTYTSRKQGFITDAECGEACAYLSSHPEVQEILFSGGDPLTVSNDALRQLIRRVRRARPGILIRICTRAPIAEPERFDSELIALFKENAPLWVIPHVNHPAEISNRFSPESYRALSGLVSAGIPVQSQTVLLRGVNDSVPVLAQLFHELTCMGIKPGYLFQGDLAPGTSHLRVPIREGVKLYERLRGELSGLSTPVYAVDLPGGGGKINLLQLDPELLRTGVSQNGNDYLFTDANGNGWTYPKSEYV